MEKLIKIAILAFTEFQRAQRMTGKFSAAAACAVAAFFTCLATVGCVVAAFWIYITPKVGEAGAALWSAVLLLAISAGLALSARLGFRMNSGRPRNDAFSELGAQLGDGVLRGKGSALISALLAGLACGRK